MGSVCADFCSALTCWAGILNHKAARKITAVSWNDIYLMHENIDCAVLHLWEGGKNESSCRDEDLCAGLQLSNIFIII